MQNLATIFQVVIALGLLNVWLIRFNRQTAYRGGGAKSMREEFSVYGLPAWTTFAIGALKVGSAIALLAGFWVPALVGPAAAVLAALMVGALVFHAKVRDPLKRSIPALLMLGMSIAVIVFHG